MNNTLKLSLVLFFLFSVLCLLFSAPAGADIPRTFNFQAKLTDTNGSPIETSQPMTFTLTDTSGNPVWQETKTVSVQEGVLSVILGPFPETLTFDKQYSLSVSIGN